MVAKMALGTEVSGDCLVNVNRNDDGWNVNVNPVNETNEWNEGNRLTSRNYGFSPRLWSGSFCLQPFLPPAQLSANLG